MLTSISDVLAGLALASGFIALSWDAILLILSTACLYAGGIVFNDYFDRHIDRVERPERPIPSGQISPSAARLFGIVLYLIALLAAWLVGIIPGLIATTIVFLATLYDRWMKHSSFGGPVFMGMARAANLLLGVSYSLEALHELYWIGVIPLLFIASVTLTSREENRGNNRRSILLAMMLDLVVVVLLILTTFQIGDFPWVAVALITVWSIMVLSSKRRAYIQNTPENIKNAVKTGVMSLILMDATYAGMVPDFPFVVVILSLWPLSVVLARKFSVT